MNRQTTHVFDKGINRRVDIERTDDPNRLYTLQNTRLYKRGETGYASRISGFEQINDVSLENVLDIKHFRDDFIIVLYRRSDTSYFVRVYNRHSGTQVFAANYFSDNEEDGKLLVQENTVFISPHNKQLNRFGVQWYLNDFESTTPQFTATLSDEILQEFYAEGSVTIVSPVNEVDGLQEYTGTINIVNNTNITFSYSDGITASTLAGIIRTALVESYLGADYEFELIGSTINIKAKQVGQSYDLYFTFAPDQDGGFVWTPINVAVTAPSAQPLINGNLNPEETYWYTVRYVYRDGHKTKTAFPKKIVTTNTRRQVELDVDVIRDLDNNYSEIEIFRRRGDGQFFYISRITPDSSGTISFTDNGLSVIRTLDEQNYVWSKRHDTHEIVRDRYVRANVQYPDKNFDGNATVSITPQDSEVSTPVNTNVNIYSRVRFENGTESFFKLKDSIDIDESGKIQIVQSQYTAEEPIKEVGYYASYTPLIDEQQETIEFSSYELANEHLPTVATFEDDSELQERPLSPQILVGYRQFKRFSVNVLDVDGNPTNEVIVRDLFRDDELGTDTIYGSVKEIETVNTYTLSEWESFSDDDIYPIYIEREIIEGIPLLYKKKYQGTTRPYDLNEGPVFDAIYELAWSQGLLEYISATSINYTFEDIPSNASNSVSNSDILDRVETSIGYIDQLTQQSQEVTVSDVFLDFGTGGDPVAYNTLFPAENNKIYITFQIDGFYNNITSEAVNNYEFPDNFESTFRGMLLNIAYLKDETPVQEITTVDGTQVTRYTYSDEVIQTIPDIAIDEGTTIYLGSLTNTNQTTLLDHTGFIKRETNGFVNWALDSSNIYNTLVERQDLRHLEDNFPNQLIWSRPFVLGTGFSGTRTFDYENALDIARDYGPIIDIRYMGNNLIVFCERGVAQVNVGEVLTQQPSGETFVDTSRFLTGFSWLLKNVPRIERNSIVEFEHSLFFSDGLDIWIIDQEGMRNISLGSVDLQENAALYGSIDPKNSEYRLYDGVNTWAYNYEVGEFMGPYTYQQLKSTNVRDFLYTITNNRLVEHNKGNTFNGNSYESVVESVSNDLNEPSIIKLFRSFFIDVEGDSTFRYGKKHDNFAVVPLSAALNREHYYKIGVLNRENNSPRMFWKITSSDPDFVLKMVSFSYATRNRR